jgi:hypothetical protein
MLYLKAARRRAAKAGEGYGEGHLNEPEAFRPMKSWPIR